MNYTVAQLLDRHTHITSRNNMYHCLATCCKKTSWNHTAGYHTCFWATCRILLVRAATSGYKLQELRALVATVSSTYPYSDIQKQNLLHTVCQCSCCAAFLTLVQLAKPTRAMRGRSRTWTASNLDAETLAENAYTAEWQHPFFLILGCVCAVYRHGETHKTPQRRGFGTSVPVVPLVSTSLKPPRKPHASTTTVRNVASPTHR